MGVCPAADGCSQGGIGKELGQRGRQRHRGRGRHEHAAAVGQQLGRVGVRRGHDRAAGAHRVGHRPGHDLVEVGIRRHEDVGRLEPLRQLDPPDVPIDEPDVILEPQSGHGCDQALAVGLALAAKEVRVRLADHDIQDRRMRGDHVGQRGERELVALARTQEAEAQDDLATLHAQGWLDRDRIDEREFRDAVRDDMQAAPVDTVRRSSGDRPRIAT